MINSGKHFALKGITTVLAVAFAFGQAWCGDKEAPANKTSIQTNNALFTYGMGEKVSEADAQKIKDFRALTPYYFAKKYGEDAYADFHAQAQALNLASAYARGASAGSLQAKQGLFAYRQEAAKNRIERQYQEDLANGESERVASLRKTVRGYVSSLTNFWR